MGRTILRGFAPSESEAGPPTITVSTNVDAQVNSHHFCDTSSGSITLTLPSTPVQGDYIRIYDISNTFDTNNLIIARNGKLIMGDAEDLTVATEGAAFEIIFYDDTSGWRIFTI